MWMIVLFDLPVLTRKERKAANGFRHFLLDQGFEMSQFSVYMRHCVGKEQVEAMIRRVGKAVPPTGRVHVLTLTDKQYETTVCFDGRARQPQRKNPEQYVLF
ncbi:CRISPR-associated endonuclease Cas2 [Azospirillum sp. A39]|uniref:CRISPR-associated endonuclease Cas2 n=1 Tax=Azospirillum sp. A39 TaxID=3462279 RepID=UPI004046641C